MRIVPLCVLFVVFCSLTLAQSEKLPDVLIPDAASAAEAKRMGANVFRLVPRGMFAGPFNAYKDEENPIGLREGGAYYSFATGLHSYNKIPEIGLEQGNLSSGFAGYNYGFLVDLGAKELENVETSPEVKFFISYKPPVYEKDIRREQGSVHMRRIDELAMTLRGYVQARAGDAYLLRAISWDQADVAVAFRILRIDEDGSVTIVWKSLAKFPKPFYLFMTDDELRDKVNEIIAEEKLADVEFTVKDNWLYVQCSGFSMSKLHSVLSDRLIRYRGETWNGHDFPTHRPTE